MLWPLKRLQFYLIFIILLGNKDIYTYMDEFEYRSDPITDYRV